MINPEESVKSAIPEKEYDILRYLIGQAENTLRILTFTKDFSILKEIDRRVATWYASSETLMKEYDVLAKAELVERLDALVVDNLPLP
jgi:hypothetical protein